MSLTLYVFDDHQNRIAVSKSGSFVDDGVFFLDFTRRIEVTRWFGTHNRWIGFANGLLVPVIHQDEQCGGYVIWVGIRDPYFKDLRTLWKQRYPSKEISPISESNGLKIIADFAAQFPEDCK